MKRRVKRAGFVMSIMLCLVFLAGRSETRQYDLGSVSNSEEKEYGPVKTAVYALEYCGWNSCTETETNENTIFAEKCIQWLIDHAVLENNCYVWKNVGTDEYTGNSANGEWMGAYTQAMVMDAFLAYYELSGDEQYLKWAQKAAEILKIDVSDGGLLTREEDFVWFETMNINPGKWELIGHLRALVALKHLTEYNGQKEYYELFEEGRNTLQKLLKYFDTDYCLRDDLRVKDQAEFRFFNDYGDENHIECIKSITLRNSLDGTQQLLENVDKDGTFTCKLPAGSGQYFGTECLELVIQYEDREKQHMTLKKESLLENGSWVPVKDGDFLLTGNGGEKEWVIPLRMNDFGYEVSPKLMGQYAQCFAVLSEGNPGFDSVKDRSIAYCNLNKENSEYRIVHVEKEELPTQIPVTVICSFDENGVLMQHGAVMGETEYDKDGTYLPPSIVGEPFYSLYVICEQAMYGKDYWSFYNYDIDNFTKYHDFWNSYHFLSIDNKDQIKKGPAYQWLEGHAERNQGRAVWRYEAYNCYNNLEQQPGWISAYGQSLVLTALMRAPDKYRELLKEGSYAFDTPVDDGGLAAYDDKGNVWFEEVPNKSHILNADILAINTLYDVNAILKDNMIDTLIENGIESLKNKLWYYDTGYWSKYDMNPKIESLYQIDWIEGEDSPLIDSITFWDPMNDTAVQIDVGDTSDSSEYPSISGIEWNEAAYVDGISVRSFQNGYVKEHAKDTNGTVHNVYFYGVLPAVGQNDYFDILGYKLMIRYKDVAKGIFEVKRQSICEGNYLKFEQIPGARIICEGDGKWKEAEIWIRAQDLGWYMGAEYQEFHVEQIEKLAEVTDDILLKQYAEKWKYYLAKQEEYE